MSSLGTLTLACAMLGQWDEHGHGMLLELGVMCQISKALGQILYSTSIEKIEVRSSQHYHTSKIMSVLVHLSLREISGTDGIVGLVHKKFY